MPRPSSFKRLVVAAQTLAPHDDGGRDGDLGCPHLVVARGSGLAEAGRPE
jgi:hypothetical protein